jgi:hypothetical protein
VNSICTGSLGGSARLIFRDGNTTSVAHVLSVVRMNVRRAGVPARSETLAGSNPCSFMTIFAVCALAQPLRSLPVSEQSYGVQLWQRQAGDRGARAPL